MRRVTTKERLPEAPRSFFDLDGRTLDLDAPAAYLGFGGDNLIIATGAGTVYWEGIGETQAVRTVHDGGILCAALAPDRASLVTGGDDGCVRLTDPGGDSRVLYCGPKWIDAVACSEVGALAWSSGRALQIGAWSGGASHRRLPLASTCRSLAFSPDGAMLAAAQYGGVALIDPNDSDRPPRLLKWAGAHLVTLWSPDGRFVVSGMLENELHVWRVDSDDEAGTEAFQGRMAGYNGRPLSLDWTGDGRLVTSGADCVVLWPFDAPKGPVSLAPEVFGQSPAAVKSVACHPTGGAVALGYQDGAVGLASLDQREIVLLRYPDGDAIIAVTFNGEGDLIGFASDGGQAGIADLKGMSA